MPRFKRLLWLFAWSVWVYLGVGLYRELPRDLGPILRRLPFGDDNQPVGWLDGGKTIITDSFNGDWFTGGNRRYRLWDVASGEMIADREGPLIDTPRPPTFYAPPPPLVGVRQGVVVGRPQAGAPRALDLRTGLWTNLGTERSPIEIHPLRPWVAMRHDGVERRDSGAVVVDLRTGAVVLERRMQEDERLNTCHFVGDSDVLLIDIRSADEWRKRKQTFERWDVGAGTRVSSCTISDAYLHTSRPGGNGFFIGYRSWSDGRRFDVVDPLTGSVVYGCRSSRDFTSFWTGPEMYASDEHEASLSEDGRALLNNGSLVALPSGTKLRSGDDESIWFVSTAKGEAVRIEEQFGLWLRDLLPATIAFRDPGTSLLLQRVWATHPRLIEDDDGRLVCDPAGNIYELPLRVNWSLLALCQAILALPLVLLWTALRWRRRRATRRQLAEAAP